MSSANVTITSGKQTGDTLWYTGTLPSGVTASYNATTGILGFTGSATVAQYQALLRTVTFKSLSSSASVTRNISFTLGSAIAYNGHFYMIVNNPSYYTWTAAKADAATKTLFGLQGYMVTITSAAENNLLQQKLLADAWIGASDDYLQINGATGTTTYANQTASEGKYYWITGPEKGSLFSVGNVTPVVQTGWYANWAPGGPNNWSSIEHCAHFFTNGTWDDWANSTNVTDYVCEFGGMPGDPTVVLSYSRNVSTTSASLATLTTTSPSLLTATSATLGGNVTADGGATVTERGVVYATTANPTTANNKVTIGAGTGTFSQNVTGLTASTTYHVRAYAINSAGTSYGGDSTFTTPAVPPGTAATVSTAGATLIATTLATLGGTVSDSGSASVTERGIVYATSANPTTTSGNKVTMGIGIGAFSQTVTGLTASTTYHVRAYAINSVGTSYGGDSTFTTLAALTLASVTTAPATLIDSNKATLGGNVVSTGGAAVTERGVVYSTTANPTTANTKVAIGSGTGIFSQVVTGLMPSTTYHVRAYAINSVGTSYGGDSMFTTLAAPIAPGEDVKPAGAMTPNGDGLNDTWYIDNPALLKGHEIVVFNIFGQEVFHQTGYDTPWDGKKDGEYLPAGEYYFLISGDKINKKGAIVLMNK